jgi:transposase
MGTQSLQTMIGMLNVVWFADRLKVLVYDGVGMWLCARRLQAGGFAWPRDRAGAFELTREQFDWLVAGLPWQRLSAPQPQRITVN